MELGVNESGSASNSRGRAGLNRLRKNSFGVSFRGAAGDEESRIFLKTLRARFLAPLGMTAWKGFSAPCEAPPFRFLTRNNSTQKREALKNANPLPALRRSETGLTWPKHFRHTTLIYGGSDGWLMGSAFDRHSRAARRERRPAAFAKTPPSFQHRATLHPALLLVKPLATDTDQPGASSFTECGVQLSECLCEEPRARTVTRG